MVFFDIFIDFIYSFVMHLSFISLKEKRQSGNLFRDGLNVFKNKFLFQRFRINRV